MEKYAIDLEKVLDDFEFREKQSHKFPSDQRTLNDTFGSNFDINENMYSRHYRTPATNYRRPPFEPMNLADADFSIASKSSSCLQTAATATSDPSNVSYPTDQRPTAALLRNDNDDNGIVGVSDVESSDIESSSAVASKYSCDFKLDQRPVQIDFSFTFDSKDYAPDLIESNRDLCANLNKFGLAERHLPDIASANIAASAPLEENDRVVDESSHGIVDSAKSDKQSSIKDESVIVARNGTPSEVNDCDSAEKLVSFRISNDVTDLALKQYLDELVENENLNSQHEYTTTGSDLSPRNDDIAEEYTEITEDCSYSTTAELEDKAGNDTECSSSDNFDAPKSSFSSENDNRDYHLLSDNVLLISSSVDSQENFDSDCGVHNDSTFNENDNDHDNDNGNNLADRRSSPIDEDAWSSRSGQNDFERELVSDLAPPLYHTQSANEMLREYGIKENNNSQSPVPFIETEIERTKPSSCSVGETANAIEHLSTVYNLTADRTNNHETTSQVIVDENAASEECITTPVVVNYRDNFNASPNFNLQTLDSKTAILNFDSSHHHHHQHHYHQAPRRLNDSITPNLQHAAGPSSDCEQRCGELDASLVSSSSADLDHVPIEEDTFDDSSSTKPQRPDSLNLLHTTQNNDMSSTSADSGSLLSVENRKLGKEAPYWVPDSDSAVCMLCQLKFNPVIRRRHHCRACGMVVCAKCSDKKASLEYLGFKEDRVCHTCHGILQKTVSNAEPDITSAMKRPNPNNPMEYCSTIPPLMQVSSAHHPTLSVLVPKVGVLKREGRARTNNLPKQVIFSDGIRPGGDLTELDVTSEPKLPLRRSSRITKRVGTPPANLTINRRLLNPDTRSFIPSGVDLPPLVSKVQGECIFTELEKPLTVDSEPVKFAINRNLFVAVKRLILDCCVHKEVWCVTTEGMSCVGHDEIVFVLEIIADEKRPPKDIFSTINVLYQEASKGSTVTEMSFAAPCTNQLFESKDHGGFIFIRPTYQCVQKLLLPKPPFLVGLLIHRWETPWARLFPIRLVLRLGAEYRYYPCTLVSVRNRPALFSEIGHTIFTLLADFRKYTYTLPTVRGLMIHMEDKLTTILLPRNRYDQVIRALNNSEENVLAFAGNISTTADSHLVCIQSIQQEDTTYHTQAINILNKPRQVTGASFIVFNGSLKQCGWSGKSNIVEDGLMVQIPSESMTALRNALRQMKNYSIGCGPQAEEMVVLKWAPDDVNFNIGVKSEIDSRALDGVPSIRVHNGVDYSGNLRLIRWTEVFILQSEDEGNNKTGDSINISKLAESVAKATCIALVPLLDLLATANLTTLAVRASIHAENVGYEAGSRGEKLPPIYMKSLDEELIAVIHEAAVSMRDVVNPIVLELIFKVMEQG